MSYLNSVQLEFGGGEYTFALNGREVEEMQKLCGAPGDKGQMTPVGFGLIYQRATLGAWFHGDIYHAIRLGLEGGGLAPVDARRVADAYARPPYRAGIRGGPEQTALAVMQAAMHGLEDIPKGEAVAPKAQ